MITSPDRKTRWTIYRNEGFYPEYSDFLEGGVKLLAEFNKKRFQIKKNTEVSYRIINHWSELGLINESRELSSQWRKFSIVDFVWHSVILKLRNFGFPNAKIRLVKECLFNDRSGLSHLFEFYIAKVIAKQPVFILVFEDGLTELATRREIACSENLGLLDRDYIQISLNNLMQKIISSKDFKPIFEPGIPLSKEELDLIEQTKSNGIESVQARLKNGKIVLIESVEDISKGNKKIIDILGENDFQDVEIKRQDGKIVSIKRTTRKKP